MAGPHQPVHTIGIDQDAFQPWLQDINDHEDGAPRGRQTAAPRGNSNRPQVQAQGGDLNNNENGETPSRRTTTPWWVDPIRTGPAVKIVSSISTAKPLSQQRGKGGKHNHHRPSSKEDVVSLTLTLTLTESARPKHTHKQDGNDAQKPTGTAAVSETWVAAHPTNYPPTHQPPPPNNGTPVALIAGVAAAVFFIGVVGFLLILFFRRRRHKMGSADNNNAEKDKCDSDDARYSVTFSEVYTPKNEKGNSIGDLEGEQTSSKVALTSAAAIGGARAESPSSQNTIRHVPASLDIGSPGSDSNQRGGCAPALMYLPSAQQITHEPEISRFTVESEPSTPPLLPDLPPRPTPPRTTTRSRHSSHSHSMSAAVTASPQRSPRNNPSSSSISTLDKSAEAHQQHKNRKRSQTANSLGGSKSPRFPTGAPPPPPTVKGLHTSLGPYIIFPKERSVNSNVSPITPPPSMPLPPPTTSPQDGLNRASSTGSMGLSKLKPRSPNVRMSINEASTSPRPRIEDEKMNEENLLLQVDAAGNRSSSINSSPHSSILDMGIGMSQDNRSSVNTTQFKDIEDSPVMSRRLTEQLRQSMRTIASNNSDLMPLLPDSNVASCNISSFEFDLSEIPPRDVLRPPSMLPSCLRKSEVASTEFDMDFPIPVPSRRSSLALVPGSDGGKRARVSSSLYVEQVSNNGWQNSRRSKGISVDASPLLCPSVSPIFEEDRKESIDSQVSTTSSTEEPYVGTARQVDVISLKDNESRVSVSTIVTSRPGSRTNVRFSTSSEVAQNTTAGRAPTPMGLVVNMNALSPEPLRIHKMSPTVSRSPSPAIPEEDEEMEALEAADVVRRALAGSSTPLQQQPQEEEFIVKDGRVYSSSTMKFVDYYRSSQYSHPSPGPGSERCASFVPFDELPPLPSNNSPTLVSGLPGSIYQNRPMSIPASADSRVLQMAINNKRDGLQLLEEPLLKSPLLLFAPTMERTSFSEVERREIVKERKASIDEIALMGKHTTRHEIEQEEEEEDDDEGESSANTTFESAVSGDNSGSTTPTTATTPLDDGGGRPSSPVIGEFLSADRAKDKVRSKREGKASAKFDFGDIFSSSGGW